MRPTSDAHAPLRSCLVPIYILLFLAARYLFVTVDFERLSSGIRPKQSHSDSKIQAPLEEQQSSAIHNIDVIQQNSTSIDFAKASPACRPRFLLNGRKITGIFFLHMRKAAGSTIRSYLAKVARHYNLTFQAHEGMKTNALPMDPNTLYVTNLREPVARTISNYKYSERWDCKKQLTKKNFIPTLNNTRGVSLREFVETNVPKKTVNVLWECGSNCYTRWASSTYFAGDSCSMDRDDEQVQLARNLLLEFHLIVHTERLEDRSYAQGIEHMFGVDGLVGRHYSMFCGPESDAANKKFPLEISNATIRRIEECNVADRLLYKEFMTCDKGIEFPLFNRSYFM